jgi:hypothetical protein
MTKEESVHAFTRQSRGGTRLRYVHSGDVAHPARGQAPLAGVVGATSAAALPGATEEAASPALIERSTDGRQRRLRSRLHHRPATPAQRLHRHLCHRWFQPVERPGVRAAGSEVIATNAETPIALQETITVTGETLGRPIRTSGSPGRSA